MSWSTFHRESEKLAIEAQLAARGRKHDLALDLYRKAADAERRALALLPKDKVRTRAITAVSAVALCFKAREYAAAEQIACEMLADKSLPEFARTDLRNLVQAIWTEAAKQSAGVSFLAGQVTVSVKGDEVVKGAIEGKNMRSREDFVDALVQAYAQSRSVFFVTGSGTTCAAKDIKGVPSCSEIVQSILSEFLSSAHVNEKAAAATLQHTLASKGVDEAYKAAMETLAVLRGRPGVNYHIQRLVDGVYHGVQRTAQAKHSDYKHWSIRPGVLAIGELLAKFPDSYSFVLTTNFDPLLEVAIRSAGAKPNSVIFNSRTSYPFDLGRVPVLHVHGFWAGDTMHSTEELTAARPTLVSLLEREFESLDSQPVVIGYGGWTDNVMQVLASCISSDHSNKTLFWAIYKSGDEAYSEANQILARMNKLVPHRSDVFRERIVFFCGVDSDWALPDLRDKVRAISTESLEKRLQKLQDELDDSSAGYNTLFQQSSYLRDENQRLKLVEQHLRGRLAEKDQTISSQLSQLNVLVADLKAQAAHASGSSTTAIANIDSKIEHFRKEVARESLTLQQDFSRVQSSLSAGFQSISSKSGEEFAELLTCYNATSDEVKSAKSTLVHLNESATNTAELLGKFAKEMADRTSDVRLLKRLLVAFLRDHKASWRIVMILAGICLVGLVGFAASWLF